MAQSSETVRAVGCCFVCVALVHLLIVVGVVIVDERGQEACSAGFCKGIGGQVLEFSTKSIPFLKKGREHCRVLLRIVIESVVVIVVEWVDDGSGVSFLKITGRDFT